MKMIGKLVCLLGSVAAILFPPYNLLGHVEWGFVFDNIVGALGVGIPIYEHINYIWLGGELVVVNLIGFLMMRMK